MLCSFCSEPGQQLQFLDPPVLDLSGARYNPEEVACLTSWRQTPLPNNGEKRRGTRGRRLRRRRRRRRCQRQTSTTMAATNTLAPGFQPDPSTTVTMTHGVGRENGRERRGGDELTGALMGHTGVVRHGHDTVSGRIRRSGEGQVSCEHSMFQLNWGLGLETRARARAREGGRRGERYWQTMALRLAVKSRESKKAAVMLQLRPSCRRCRSDLTRLDLG